MELIGELREEVKELRDRVDKVQKELDSCKRDFYELTEKYLGIVRG
jgi:archaellum component FlaC